MTTDITTMTIHESSTLSDKTPPIGGELVPTMDITIGSKESTTDEITTMTTSLSPLATTNAKILSTSHEDIITTADIASSVSTDELRTTTGYAATTDEIATKSSHETMTSVIATTPISETTTDETVHTTIDGITTDYIATPTIE